MCIYIAIAASCFLFAVWKECCSVVGCSWYYKPLCSRTVGRPPRYATLRKGATSAPPAARATSLQRSALLALQAAHPLLHRPLLHRPLRLLCPRRSRHLHPHLHRRQSRPSVELRRRAMRVARVNAATTTSRPASATRSACRNQPQRRRLCRQRRSQHPLRRPLRRPFRPRPAPAGSHTWCSPTTAATTLKSTSTPNWPTCSWPTAAPVP